MTAKKVESPCQAAMKLARGLVAMTQQEFARFVGVTFVTVNRWENGRCMPHVLAVEKIVRLLDDTAPGLGDDRAFDAVAKCRRLFIEAGYRDAVR